MGSAGAAPSYIESVTERLLDECGRPVGGALTTRMAKRLTDNYMRRLEVKGEAEAYRLLRKNYVDLRGASAHPPTRLPAHPPLAGFLPAPSAGSGRPAACLVPARQHVRQRHPASLCSGIPAAAGAGEGRGEERNSGGPQSRAGWLGRESPPSLPPHVQ